MTSTTIAKIKDRLREINPAKIILFGSHANGQPEADSDIDLIVVLDRESSNGDFRQRMADTIAVRNLLADLNREVALDILVYNRTEWESFLKSESSFSKEVISRGVQLQ